jgi:uncharacterized protein (DUF4415 family)
MHMQANKPGGSRAFLDPADDAPEFTDEMFDQAELRQGDTVIRAYRGPGRPKIVAPKPQVTIRLDADLLERLRSTGPGWQSRLNEAVRAWVNLAVPSPK